MAVRRTRIRHRGRRQGMYRGQRGKNIFKKAFKLGKRGVKAALDYCPRNPDKVLRAIRAVADRVPSKGLKQIANSELTGEAINYLAKG